jgi:hypothetical protein
MKNHYFCSINTHFWKLVVILSSIFLRIMVANTEIMGCCLCIAIWVTKMQLQKLLMLLWRSFLGGGSDIITNIFAHTGGSFCHCGLMMLHSPLIIEDARQKVADPRLTLILQIGQWVCRILSYLYRRQILAIRKDVSLQPFDCPTNRTKNYAYSNDIHL